MDIEQVVEDAKTAFAAEDTGRVMYLVDEISDWMLTLTVQQAEWLNIAVSNGAFNRGFKEHQDEAVTVTTTSEGEIWDI